MSRLPRTLPPTELGLLWEMVDKGVCGGVGVVIGRVGGCEELVAVTRGTEPSVGVGLLITLAADGGWAGDEVAAIDPAEFVRAGLDGGAGTVGLID